LKSIPLHVLLLINFLKVLYSSDETGFAAALQGIGGSRDVGFGQKRVRSVPDAIARALHTYLHSKSEMPKQEETVLAPDLLPSAEGVATGNLCIECGSPTVKQEGCEKCHACGWSNC
jgi:ribonucleoside-diphosphate reductase alpha chain